MELINRRIARWIMLLQDFNVKVKHINGKLNSVADYLSRNLAVAPSCSQCKKKMKILTVTSIESREVETQRYQEAIATDPLIIEVKAWQANPKTEAQSLLLKQFKEVAGKWFLVTVYTFLKTKISSCKSFVGIMISLPQGIKEYEELRQRLLNTTFGQVWIRISKATSIHV